MNKGRSRRSCELFAECEMCFCLDFTTSDSDISCFRTGVLVLCDSFSNGFWFFLSQSFRRVGIPGGIWKIVVP